MRNREAQTRSRSERRRQTGPHALGFTQLEKTEGKTRRTDEMQFRENSGL